MVSAVKWEGAFAAATVVINTGATLAADTLSALGTEYDNSSGLNTMAWFEVDTSDATDVYALAVTRVNASIDLYLVKAMDGTNYENEPATADILEFPHLFVGAIPIATEIGNRMHSTGPILIPPCKFKMMAFNNSDQTITAEWQIDMYLNNLEGQ